VVDVMRRVSMRIVTMPIPFKYANEALMRSLAANTQAARSRGQAKATAKDHGQTRTPLSGRSIRP
jgi:hypothetical protein